MHYHIILTERCNLQCKYCYGKSMQEFDNGLEKKFTFDYTEPCTSQIDIQKLKTFIEKDPEATIIFYGGEPLLQIDKIKQIIENINVPFRMQTNGQLLHLLPKEYLNRITKILISIDGNETVTDFYRGEGTYEKLKENIGLIRANGYAGELVARMTVVQDNPDVFKNVTNILEMKLFDSVHWQLDANFYKKDFDKERIGDFFDKYNASIAKLVDFWVSEIQKGNFINLYPFTGITARLLGIDKETCIMCGAGCKGYAISTSGKVVACPIMNNIKDFECGNLDSEPADLRKIETVSPCTDCEEKGVCGGRCLYSNHAKLWPREGEELVCGSVRFLIEELRKGLPGIREKTKESDFEYEKYFGPEIIP